MTMRVHIFGLEDDLVGVRAEPVHEGFVERLKKTVAPPGRWDDQRGHWIVPASLGREVETIARQTVGRNAVCTTCRRGETCESASSGWRQRRRSKSRGEPPVPKSLEELPLFLSVKEVAAALRVNKKLIYEEIKRGRFPGKKLGKRKFVILSEELLEWFRQGRVSPSEDTE